MIFGKRSPLPAPHAFLSPSNYHWINYTREKLLTAFRTAQAAKLGTDYHELAHRLITLGEPLPERQRTLNLYVNDALEYGMTPEFPLYYSDHCFGTADAISFRDGLLRVHDLKTGISPTSEKQLYVYSALFCLQFNRDPFDLKFELRIYQLDEIRCYYPDSEIIKRIMDTIVEFSEALDMETTDLEDL